jgi:hypothetical protein
MKHSLIARMVLAFALAAGVASAQEPRVIAPQIPCPFPVVQHFPSGPAATPVLSEFPVALRPLVTGSVWNQTAINKAFGHTFRFTAPKDCCAITGGVLTIHIKALQGGPGATSANDGMHVYVGGVSIYSQALWSSSVHTGDTTTLNIPITANHLTSGLVSFYIEDDTAAVSADLEIDSCCVTKRP